MRNTHIKIGDTNKSIKRIILSKCKFGYSAKSWRLTIALYYSTIIVADTYYASSTICPTCGNKKETLLFQAFSRRFAIYGKMILL